MVRIGVDIKGQDDAASFLGIKREHDAPTSALEFKQTGLIDQILEPTSIKRNTVEV